jgi:hypothetical protein
MTWKNVTPEDLALAREQTAADLERAIAALGEAYARYQDATQQLGDHVGDLSERLALPIAMHLARAGLATFLERRPVGTPGSLRSIVANEHAREGLGNQDV